MSPFIKLKIVTSEDNSTPTDTYLSIDSISHIMAVNGETRITLKGEHNSYYTVLNDVQDIVDSLQVVMPSNVEEK